MKFSYHLLRKCHSIMSEMNSLTFVPRLTKIIKRDTVPYVKQSLVKMYKLSFEQRLEHTSIKKYDSS